MENKIKKNIFFLFSGQSRTCPFSLNTFKRSYWHLNRFVNNTALSYGGGLFALNSDVIMDSCFFVGNNSDDHGGGLYILNNDSLSYKTVSIENTVNIQVSYL